MRRLQRRDDVDGGNAHPILSFLGNFLLGFLLALVVAAFQDLRRGTGYKDYLDY